jgi:tRNA isopentenyl-2-thiomethyl-A-37 hydroxylase MiaE
MAAFNLVSDLQAFIFLNKSQQDIKLVDEMVASAREKVSMFQKVAQVEVTKFYQKM